MRIAAEFRLHSRALVQPNVLAIIGRRTSAAATAAAFSAAFAEKIEQLFGGDREDLSERLYFAAARSPGTSSGPAILDMGNSPASGWRSSARRSARAPLRRRLKSSGPSALRSISTAQPTPSVPSWTGRSHGPRHSTPRPHLSATTISARSSPRSADLRTGTALPVPAHRTRPGRHPALHPDWSRARMREPASSSAGHLSERRVIAASVDECRREAEARA